MKTLLWALAFGYIVNIVTGFNPSNWQWWALFGGAVVGIIINAFD